MFRVAKRSNSHLLIFRKQLVLSSTFDIYKSRSLYKISIFIDGVQAILTLTDVSIKLNAWCSFATTIVGECQRATWCENVSDYREQPGLFMNVKKDVATMDNVVSCVIFSFQTISLIKLYFVLQISAESVSRSGCSR